jgi:hypothetical protein
MTDWTAEILLELIRTGHVVQRFSVWEDYGDGEATMDDDPSYCVDNKEIPDTEYGTFATAWNEAGSSPNVIWKSEGGWLSVDTLLWKEEPQ